MPNYEKIIIEYTLHEDPLIHEYTIRVSNFAYKVQVLNELIESAVDFDLVDMEIDFALKKMTRWMNFWDWVEICDHKNLSSDYCPYIACPTPYCSGYETHCLDCGVYISECGCHSCSGLSGWSQKRRQTWRERNER